MCLYNTKETTTIYIFPEFLSWKVEWRLSHGQYEWLDTLGENNKTNSRNNEPSSKIHNSCSNVTITKMTNRIASLQQMLQSRVKDTRVKVWESSEYYGNPSRF